MRVIWTPEAQQDREDIFDYISRENSAAAVRIDKLFSNATARLNEYPEIGRSGKILGTRELIPHESYRLIYEISQQSVWILALVHTARQWPPLYKKSELLFTSEI